LARDSLLLISQTAFLVVNEVASASVTVLNACANGADYVEIYNAGSSAINPSNYIIHDDKGPGDNDAYVWPAGAPLVQPGQYRLFCQTTHFQFGIGATDTITLRDSSGTVLSTSGKLPGTGSASLTYQRTDLGTYGSWAPSPNARNTIPSGFKAEINEVALVGTANTNVCNGDAFVEILNTGANSLNLAGFTLYNSWGPTNPSAYTFPIATPTIPFGGYAVFCKGTTFKFDIDMNDKLSLRTPSGEVVSTTGAIGGTSPRPKQKDLTWIRVTDLVNKDKPFTPFYQYTSIPTPGAYNIYPFTPQPVTVQSCGVQTQALHCLFDYGSPQKFLIDRDDFSRPEFSGGAHDGSTCNNLLIGDEGNINEVAFRTLGSFLVTKYIRSIPLIGGSGDTEGICYYSPGKVAIIDEIERSGTHMTR
jgi:Lamin Tail Domain